MTKIGSFEIWFCFVLQTLRLLYATGRYSTVALLWLPRIRVLYSWSSTHFFTIQLHGEPPSFVGTVSDCIYKA